MNCPVCGERLRPIQRSGIEIDICPGCKGIWLDRGELEKLIALEGQDAPDAPPDMAQAASVRGYEQRPRMYDDHDDHDKHNSHHREEDRYDNRHQERTSGQHGARRRGSLLGDILGSFGGGDD